MTFYETRFVRAVDLTGEEVVRVDGTWRELLDVWKAGDDPLTFFGPDSDIGTRIHELIDYASPVWVVLRYVVPERCTACEIEDDLKAVFVHNLVQVQVPMSTRLPTVPAPDLAQTYSLAEIRNGTGWPDGARFALITAPTSRNEAQQASPSPDC